MCAHVLCVHLSSPNLYVITTQRLGPAIISRPYPVTKAKYEHDQLEHETKTNQTHEDGPKTQITQCNRSQLAISQRRGSCERQNSTIVGTERSAFIPGAISVVVSRHYGNNADGLRVVSPRVLHQSDQTNATTLALQQGVFASQTFEVLQWAASAKKDAQGSCHLGSLRSASRCLPSYFKWSNESLFVWISIASYRSRVPEHCLTVWNFCAIWLLRQCPDRRTRLNTIPTVNAYP